MTQTDSIKYVLQKDIDIDKWNKCINQSINGLIYAHSWYLDIVSPKWDALIYGDYDAVMPLPNKRHFGINYLYQPIFTKQLGIFSRSKIDHSLIETFINSIPKKYRIISINLNKYNEVKNLKKFNISYLTTHQLDLIQNYEDIKKKYSKINIININKAVDNGLFILNGLMPNEIFKLINNSKEIPKVSAGDINIIRQIIAASIRYKLGYLYGVYNKFNTLVGAGYFLCNNDKVKFVSSVSTNEGKKQKAMFLLIDKFIQDFRGTNMILDFESSDSDIVDKFY